MKISKIIIAFLGVIFIIVLLLKPSYSRFKEFGEGLNIKPYKIVLRKTGDNILCAYFEKLTYKWNGFKGDYDLVSNEKYIGYLLNFHKIK